MRETAISFMKRIVIEQLLCPDLFPGTKDPPGLALRRGVLSLVLDPLRGQAGATWLCWNHGKVSLAGVRAMEWCLRPGAEEVLTQRKIRESFFFSSHLPVSHEYLIGRSH